MEPSTATTPPSEAAPAPAGCDVCGSRSYRKLFSGPDRLVSLPGRFTFVECTGCGLIYQQPRPAWEQLRLHYESEYPPYEDLERQAARPLGRLLLRLGPLKQRRYVERFRKGGSLMDVGCGVGDFLAEMRRSGAWQLSGLEPTAGAARTAERRLGIPIVNGLFDDAALVPASLDVVTMWNVLEHVMSPTAALEKTWQVLRPGGHLIIAIPNPESLSRRLFGRYWVGWDLPRHLYAYPRRVIERMFAERGFRILDRRCFMNSYAVLGHSLAFWTQSWPPGLQPLASRLRRAYASPLARGLVYPPQLLVERLRLATVICWTAQKVV